MWQWNKRKLAVLWLLLTACNSASAPDALSGAAARSEAEEALQKACRYLWSQQGEDGGWHSRTYALLRSGQALTPFILQALLEAPADLCPRPAGGLAKALQFIRSQTNQEGVIGLADPDILEYPNYSTAYALRCLVRAGQEVDRQLIAKMQDYLVGQQFRAENGFPQTELAFGGWGFGAPVQAGSPGHMDLPHTRRVLQALHESGLEDPALTDRATVFLRLLQRHPDETRPQPLPAGQGEAPGGETPFDGGFHFSPVVLEANKGRLQGQGAGAYFRSYATATCDGVLALLAAGASADDERVAAAIRWLERHPRWDYPEGIPQDHPEDWGNALHFYHLAVRAEAFQALSWPGDWKRELTRQLVPQQRGDGSFINSRSALMKEDDPLLCTALAVTALGSMH